MIFHLFLFSLSLALDSQNFILKFVYTKKLSEQLTSELSSINSFDLRSHFFKGEDISGSLPPLNETCVNALSSTINYFYTKPELRNMIMYSAKRMNDLGNYIECKKLKGSYYFLIGIEFMNILIIKLPVCIPRDCTIEMLSVYKPIIAETISKLAPIKFTADSIKMIDLEKTNAEIDKPNTVANACIVIFFTFVALTLLWSVLEYHGRLKLKEGEIIVWKRILGCFSFLSGGFMSFYSSVRGRTAGLGS